MLRNLIFRSARSVSFDSRALARLAFRANLRWLYL